MEHVGAAHSLNGDKRQVYTGFSNPHFQSPHTTYIWIWTAVVSFRTPTASLFVWTLSPIGTFDTGHNPQQSHSGHQRQSYPQHLQGKHVKMGKSANLTFQVFLKLIIGHLLCKNQVSCQASHTSSVLYR